MGLHLALNPKPKLSSPEIVLHPVPPKDPEDAGPGGFTVQQ